MAILPIKANEQYLFIFLINFLLENYYSENQFNMNVQGKLHVKGQWPSNNADTGIDLIFY